MQALFTFSVHKGDFQNATPIIRTKDGFRFGEFNETSYLTNQEVERAKKFFGEKLNGYILKVNEVDQ